MDWSLAYVSFLIYVFVITSYTIPIGTASMVTALIAVFMGERVRFTSAGSLFLVFFGVATVSYLGSDWKVFTYEFWNGMAKVILVFLVAQIVLINRERVRFFIFFYLGVHALFPVRGALFNYFLYHATEGGRVGWNNIFENPNDISALLLFPFALAIGLIFVERNKTLRLLAMGALICIPLVLALAQSRGAMLALGGGFGLFFLQTKRARIMMLAGVAVVGIVFVTLAPSQLWQRLGSLENAATSGNLAAANDAGSAEQRMEIWKVSVIVIEENPLIGVGPGSYPFAHVFAARDPEILRTAAGLRDAHSTYFTLMAEYGVFGFLVYMLAAGTVWHKSRTVRRQIEAVLPRHSQQLLLAEIGLISFGAAAVFGSFINLVFTYLQLAIVWALAEMAEKTAAELAGTDRTAAGTR
ncbi:MAG: O-antigen ligase family protein [Gemmatimonadaceae bacterium]